MVTTGKSFRFVRASGRGEAACAHEMVLLWRLGGFGSERAAASRARVPFAFRDSR